MWSAAIINIVLYIPLYFCVRGNIRVNPVTRKITFSFGKEQSLEGSSQSSTTAMAAHGVKSGGSKNSEALKLIWSVVQCLRQELRLLAYVSIRHWPQVPDLLYSVGPPYQRCEMDLHTKQRSNGSQRPPYLADVDHCVHLRSIR